MTGARLQARAEAIIIDHEIQAGKLTAMAGLRTCRERAGKTLKETAETAGICPETYRSWENGKSWPSGYHMAALAKTLGVSIEELYLGPDLEDAQP